MSAQALALAGAAESLVGSPFRLHGRDPATGLDCIGLLECALAMTGRRVRLPTGYSLRTKRWDGLSPAAMQLGFAPHVGPLAAGDVCLLRPSPVQMHFAIVAASAQGLVEAHAGLRRVVISPLPLALHESCPLAGLWRLVPDC